MLKQIERIFETIIWNSRFIVVAAVIASLACSLALFYMASVDSVLMIKHLLTYASSELSEVARKTLHDNTIKHVVEIVDGYLLAAVLLIFSLGLYELFISKIDPAESDSTSSNILLINSLDDLKARLAKVILMILIVNFFEHVISQEFNNPLDLLYLAGGIALIGLALFLSNAEHKQH